MTIGDTVRLGAGSIDVANINIPIYDLRRGTDGSVLFDHNGAAHPVVIGGVKGGAIGTIEDHPVKVPKTLLKGFSEGAAAVGGNEYVLLFPVFVENYQKLGWVPNDHMRVVSGRQT